MLIDISKSQGLQVMYENRVYIVTGRQAVQQKRDKVKVVWEVCPESSYADNPAITRFNRWVTPNQLMLVEDKRIVATTPMEPDKAL